MNHQALFPEKDKSKNIKCCQLQFLFGALRVKMHMNNTEPSCLLLYLWHTMWYKVFVLFVNLFFFQKMVSSLYYCLGRHCY